jgi:hypothetical protein
MKELERNLIRAWKRLFEMYPELMVLPVYAWGRYYKYELAGEPFESDVDDSGFPTQGIEDQVDMTLLGEIERQHNIPGGDIDRDACVKHFGFDNQGGKTLVLLRYETSHTLYLEVWDSDSPE